MAQKKYKLGFQNLEEKVLNNYILKIEQQLKSFAPFFDIIPIRHLDDDKLLQCELLLIGSHALGAKEFSTWLTHFHSRMQSSKRIWIPTIIMGDYDEKILLEFLTEATQKNWYFDIIRNDELDSLPIRVTNLLRIHDHLKELWRYDEEIKRLQTAVETLNDKLHKIGKS